MKPVLDKLGKYCFIFTCTNTYLCMRADLHAHLFLLSFSFYGWVGGSYIEGSVWEVPIHMLHRIFMNNMFFQIEVPFDKYFFLGCCRLFDVCRYFHCWWWEWSFPTQGKQEAKEQFSWCCPCVCARQEQASWYCYLFYSIANMHTLLDFLLNGR